MTKADDRRLTVPTQITLLRVAIAAVLGPVILAGFGLFAALLIVAAAISDFADGYLARKRNQVTSLGAALDPVADKLVTVAALVAFTIEGTLAGVHASAALIILFRETLIAGLREASSGATLAVSPLAKWKTTFQFVAFFMLCVGPSGIALGCLWVATVLTMWTGLRYVISWWTIGR